MSPAKTSSRNSRLNSMPGRYTRRGGVESADRTPLNRRAGTSARRGGDEPALGAADLAEAGLGGLVVPHEQRVLADPVIEPEVAVALDGGEPVVEATGARVVVAVQRDSVAHRVA